MITAAGLVALLEGYRFRASSESELSSGVKRVLERAGLPYQTEAALFAGKPVRAVSQTLIHQIDENGDERETVQNRLHGTLKNRIDYLVGRIGLELKVDGALQSVTRQLARYAQSDRVDFLVLATTAVRLCRVPKQLGGKPVLVALCGGGLL